MCVYVCLCVCVCLCACDTAVLQRRSRQQIFGLAALMAAFAISLAVITLIGSDTSVLVFSLLSSTILNVLAFRVLPPMLARCNFYMFLVAALYIQIDGALDYFYTAKPECACARVCLYACMCLCVYACVCVCLYACMCLCVYACVCVCMHACMHACVCMCVCMLRYIGRAFVHAHAISSYAPDLCHR